MATIKDIAARCGVSAATVSYVLNGKSEERHIKAETTKKVLRAAQELGYTLPKTVNQKPSNTQLKVLVLWPYSYPGQELMSIFSAAKDVKDQSSEPLDFTVKLFRMYDLESEWKYKEPDRFDLIIIYALTPKDMAFLSRAPHKSPIITINRRIRACASVSLDNEAAGRLACDLLFSACGKSVSAVLEEEFIMARSTRNQAFKQRAKELDIPLDKHTYFCSVNGSYEEGYWLALDLIRQGSMTKGIFFNQDHTAIGFLAAMQKNGIQAGKDFYLLAAGLGSQDLCRFNSPSITALDMKLEELTEKALLLGFDILEGKTPVDTVVTLQPGIIFRNTLPNMEW